MTVSPNILTWAVERLGQNIDEYALQNQHFNDWLSGEVKPTFNQVKDFAKRFYVPLGYMFLKTPPKEETPITFFRRTQDAKQNINVDDTVRLLSTRQEWLSEYLKNNDFNELDFVGKFHDTDEQNIDIICKYAKDKLNLKDNWAVALSNENETVNKFISVLEDIGIIVVTNGIVGHNTKRPIEVSSCRGFALVDHYAPFIFVNNKDSKVAQVFTLAHEMAHIFLGYTAGISDLDINANSVSVEENFCNKIASNFLLPSSLFISMWEECNHNIDTLVTKFKVSRYVIGIRAVELRLISKQQYNSFTEKWNKETPKFREKKRGGDFYANAVRRTSRTFLIHLNNALESRQISYTDAYALAGLKGDIFHNTIDSKYLLQ